MCQTQPLEIVTEKQWFNKTVGRGGQLLRLVMAKN
jgi:hypothetical protein